MKIRQRRPDGTVVTLFPDGTAMAPKALQVQPADLPPQPTALMDWGTGINDRLLSILQGVLTESELQAYLPTEEGRSFYELVDWRLRSISSGSGVRVRPTRKQTFGVTYWHPTAQEP